METSLFLARLIGPVLLTISAAMLINPVNMREMATDFLEHRGLIFLAGILTLLGGLAIVLTHNVWVALARHHHHLRLAVGDRRRLPHRLSRQRQIDRPVDARQAEAHHRGRASWRA